MENLYNLLVSNPHISLLLVTCLYKLIRLEIRVKIQEQKIDICLLSIKDKKKIAEKISEIKVPE